MTLDELKNSFRYMSPLQGLTHIESAVYERAGGMIYSSHPTPGYNILEKIIAIDSDRWVIHPPDVFFYARGLLRKIFPLAYLPDVNPELFTTKTDLENFIINLFSGDFYENYPYLTAAEDKWGEVGPHFNASEYEKLIECIKMIHWRLAFWYDDEKLFECIQKYKNEDEEIEYEIILDTKYYGAVQTGYTGADIDSVTIKYLGDSAYLRHVIICEEDVSIGSRLTLNIIHFTGDEIFFNLKTASEKYSFRPYHSYGITIYTFINMDNSGKYQYSA